MNYKPCQMCGEGATMHFVDGFVCNKCDALHGKYLYYRFVMSKDHLFSPFLNKLRGTLLDNIARLRVCK